MGEPYGWVLLTCDLSLRRADVAVWAGVLGRGICLGGSGFIASFLAGGIFGALVSQESEEASRLDEELGDLLGGVTFLIFGAVLLGPSLEHVSWQIALYGTEALVEVPACGHVWSAAPHERSSGGDCPRCAQLKRNASNRRVPPRAEPRADPPLVVARDAWR